ncbi:unnamed protein product, partial [marine sediment metagenome]
TPFCKKCGVEISEQQYNLYGEMCSNCYHSKSDRSIKKVLRTKKIRNVLRVRKTKNVKSVKKAPNVKKTKILLHKFKKRYGYKIIRGYRNKTYTSIMLSMKNSNLKTINRDNDATYS